MTGPLLLDLRDLGINRKGVGRVLEALTPELLELDRTRYHVACTEAALPFLPAISRKQVHVLPRAPQSAWEQVGLPAVASRIGAAATYSHRECGAWWGPPLLLHVTEDPEIRWARDPQPNARAQARRLYSKVFMPRALRRAKVGASTAAVADHLAASYGVERRDIAVIPLGVDHHLFRATEPSADRFFFHLASGDPRDCTTLVVEAFAELAKQEQDPPRLVIGGGLGDGAAELRRVVSHLGVEGLVDLTGRLTDEDLAARYSSSLACVQPASDEGFGLQPLEALACGALLVVAHEPSVVEVVGDAEAIWAERTVASLTQALARASTDTELRRRAQQANPHRARSYTWARSAEVVHRELLRLAGDTA